MSSFGTELGDAACLTIVKRLSTQIADQVAQAQWDIQEGNVRGHQWPDAFQQRKRFAKRLQELLPEQVLDELGTLNLDVDSMFAALYDGAMPIAEKEEQQ